MGRKCSDLDLNKLIYTVQHKILMVENFDEWGSGKMSQVNFDELYQPYMQICSYWKKGKILMNR